MMQNTSSVERARRFTRPPINMSGWEIPPDVDMSGFMSELQPANAGAGVSRAQRLKKSIQNNKIVLVIAGISSAAKNYLQQKLENNVSYTTVVWTQERFEEALKNKNMPAFELASSKDEGVLKLLKNSLKNTVVI